MEDLQVLSVPFGLMAIATDARHMKLGTKINHKHN
jgi:hypothetical protein